MIRRIGIMERENSSKYCYEDGVLINKYDLHDREVLQELERNITTYRISQLESGLELFQNLFEPNNYLKLHYFLFSDIYFFAGEVRDEAIHKSNAPYYSGKTLFCYPSFIYQNLSHYLGAMKEDLRKITDRKRLIQYLSYYYGELNMVHPFREGNGRTLRTFLELVVDYISKYLGLDVEIRYSLWGESDRERLLEATIVSSVTGQNNILEECFDKVIVSKEKRKISRI